VRKAPTSAIKPLTWSALGAETWNVKSGVGVGMGTSTSPEKYQSNTSATPSFASATYPSRDIDISATTLAIRAVPFARRTWRIVVVADARSDALEFVVDANGRWIRS
jgi:hypothetical protein